MQEYQYIQDILKDFYAPAIVNNLYVKSPMWAIIEKKYTSFHGKRAVIPIQTAFTEAVGSRVANNYALPAAQRNTYDQTYVTMKRLYGRIQVDGFSIEAAKDKGGWVDIVSAETKGVSTAFAMDMDRQTLGRGDCVLATVASTSGSDIVVQNAAGISGNTAATKFLKVGMVIDIHDVTNGAQHVNSLTITAVDAATSTITLSAATGISSTAAGDFIVREDSWTTTAANLGEIMGIDGIINTANHPGTSAAATVFQGIDRDVEPLWKSVVDTSSTVLTETGIQEMLDAIETQTDGDNPSLILTTYALRNKLIDIMRSERMVQTLDFKAGWKAIKYVGGSTELPVMVHKNLAPGYMYFLPLSHLKFYVLKKLVWDNKGGGILKPVAGYDAYEAWFKMYCNLATDCPNAFGKFTALTTA